MEFFQMATLVLLSVIACSTVATQVNLHEIKKLLEDMNGLLEKMEDNLGNLLGDRVAPEGR